LLPKVDIDASRYHLQERYNQGHTVNGKRSFHHFCPPKIGAIQYKLVSCGEKVVGYHSVFTVQNLYQLDDIMPQEYVAAKYDDNWWIGLVKKRDTLQNDISVEFMHPHGPSQSFHWPTSEDSCWVSLNCILLKLQVPTENGRQYQLTKNETAYLENLHK